MVGLLRQARVALKEKWGGNRSPSDELHLLWWVPGTEEHRGCCSSGTRAEIAAQGSANKCHLRQHLPLQQRASEAWPESCALGP